MKWHPDRNPDTKHEAEDQFRQATEAYSVLSDAQKRAMYDRYGHAGVQTSGVGRRVQRYNLRGLPGYFRRSLWHVGCVWRPRGAGRTHAARAARG